MSSRDLNDLRDDVKHAALLHTQLCKDAGIDLLIYCTLRSDAEQLGLYSQGRTKPGKIVTNARPGQSNHNPDKNNKARAYDCAPLIGGKPVWGNSSKEERALWLAVGTLGEEAGLVWAGRWTGALRETAHFEAKEP